MVVYMYTIYRASQQTCMYLAEKKPVEVLKTVAYTISTQTYTKGMRVTECLLGKILKYCAILFDTLLIGGLLAVGGLALLKGGLSLGTVTISVKTAIAMLAFGGGILLVNLITTRIRAVKLQQAAQHLDPRLLSARSKMDELFVYKETFNDQREEEKNENQLFTQINYRLDNVRSLKPNEEEVVLN